MGTSKNVSSPDIPPWRIALAVLGRNGVPLTRQHQEIWRSVEAERGSHFADEFSQPALATACRLATNAKDVVSTIQRFDNHLSEMRQSGFATEIARRALARTVNARLGSDGFARELFAEATSYYASRDLPSVVGSRGRVETPSQAIALKDQLKDITRALVTSVGPVAVDPDGWTRYVSKVVRGLRGAR
jgi:hypothetical protein